MAQAKAHWSVGNYAKAEKVFALSADYCSIHETWKMNLAHVYFV